MNAYLPDLQIDSFEVCKYGDHDQIPGCADQSWQHFVPRFVDYSDRIDLILSLQIER